MDMMAHRVQHLLFALAVLILFIASTYHLSESPGIWFDEGYFTQLALNLETHGAQVIQVAPEKYVSSATVSGGFPLIVPVALSYKIFGVGVAQGRAVMVLYLIMLIAAAFLLVRTLFGLRYAAWTTLLLATLPLLYGNGKPVLGEIPGLFFLIIALWALAKLEISDFHDLKWCALAGFAIGLATVTKPIFLLILPALLVAYTINFRKVHLSIRGAMIGIVSALLPLVVWVALQFGAGDTLASVLSFYTNPYEIQDISNLILNNLHQLISGATPLYILGLLFAWTTGIVIRLRSHERIGVAETTAWVFCFLILAAYLRLPGWYRYLFPAGLVALAFLPFSLERIALCFNGRFSVWAMRLVPLLLGLLVVGQLYQLCFSSYVADYYQSHRARDVAAFLQSLDPQASFFVYNVPEVVVLLPSQNYYQYIRPHPLEDMETMGRDQLSVITNGTADYIIASKSDHESDPQFFVHYRLLSTVNRYEILKRI